MCSKGVETENLFTKVEMNNDWNINFLQDSPLDIQHTYFSEFSISQSTFETPLLMLYESSLSYFFEWLPPLQIVFLRRIFSSVNHKVFKKKKKKKKGAITKYKNLALICPDSCLDVKTSSVYYISLISWAHVLI